MINVLTSSTKNVLAHLQRLLQRSLEIREKLEELLRKHKQLYEFKTKGNLKPTGEDKKN